MLFFLLFAYSCKKTHSSVNVIDDSTVVDTSGLIHLPIRGADLSYLPEMNSISTIFFDSAGAKTALQVLQEFGCNVVRVRLWHHPVYKYAGIDEVLNFCQQISANGMQILLDIHYSDTLADASRQDMPAAWAGLPFNVLKDSVRLYTQQMVRLLVNQHTPPVMVQIGNEINNGMLWGAGKVNGTADPNWANFADLVKSGIEGVKEIDASMPVMLHYGELNGAIDFFNNMKQQSVPYDVIGLSYYPWNDEKDLPYLQQQLNLLAGTFNKKILIAEMAYPFTLDGYDQTPDIVTSTSQLVPGYKATEKGQLQYMLQVKSIINAIPNQLGMGFCYWQPEWVPFKGKDATNGSAGENTTLFDFYGMALPAMRSMAP